MTYTPAPEFVQSNIPISTSRAELLASALRDALANMILTEKTPWTPYAETPTQQPATARAQRIAWLVESL